MISHMMIFECFSFNKLLNNKTKLLRTLLFKNLFQKLYICKICSYFKHVKQLVCAQNRSYRCVKYNSFLSGMVIASSEGMVVEEILREN